ncbi:hypothetical protein EJB05_16051, partial [Eragrostis curvula]
MSLNLQVAQHARDLRGAARLASVRKHIEGSKRDAGRQLTPKAELVLLHGVGGDAADLWRLKEEDVLVGRVEAYELEHAAPVRSTVECHPVEHGAGREEGVHSGAPPNHAVHRCPVLERPLRRISAWPRVPHLEAGPVE